MKKSFAHFFAFLVLLILAIPFSFDFATSIIPGWHTTIFPPYFVMIVILTIVLVFVAIAYWLASKRVDKTVWALFIIHFLITISTIIFIEFPSIFLDIRELKPDELLNIISSRMKLIPLAYWAFVAGQILFLVYFFKIVNNNRLKN